MRERVGRSLVGRVGGDEVTGIHLGLQIDWSVEHAK
jgi:hypothetical protein